MSAQGRERLSVSRLLEGLNEKELADVVDQCTRRTFSRESQIVREHDLDDNIYLIESGLLGVAQYASSGREVGYRELGPGDHFGELSAIDGAPRSANVVALRDSTVTVMPFRVLEALIHGNRSVRVCLLRHLAGMVRNLSDRVYEFSTLGVNNRIHAELLRLARKGEDLDGVARIHQPPTHAQLAGRVSCNREAVSRELGRLDKQGLLVRSRGRWEIPDMQALISLVDNVHQQR